MSGTEPPILTDQEIQEFKLYVNEVEEWIQYAEQFFRDNQFYYHIAERPQDMDLWDEDVVPKISAIYTQITEEYERLKDHLKRFNEFIPRMDRTYREAYDALVNSDELDEEERTRLIEVEKEKIRWLYRPADDRSRLMELNDLYRSWIERFERFQQTFDRIAQIGREEWRRERALSEDTPTNIREDIYSTPSPSDSETDLPPSTPASPLRLNREYNVPGFGSFLSDIDVTPDPRPLTRDEVEEYKLYRVKVEEWIKKAKDRLDLYHSFYKMAARPQDVEEMGEMDIQAIYSVYTELCEELDHLREILQTLNEYANRWDATFSGRETSTEELWWADQMDLFRWQLSDLKRHYRLWIERFDAFERDTDQIGLIGVDEWVRRRRERRERDQDFYRRSEVGREESRKEYEKTLKEGIASAGKRRGRKFHQMLSMDREILPVYRDEDEIGVNSDTRSDDLGRVHRLVQRFENLGVSGSLGGGSGAGGGGGGSSANPLEARVRNIEARITNIQTDIDRARLYSNIDNLEEYSEEDMETVFRVSEELSSIPNRIQNLRSELERISADNQRNIEVDRQLEIAEDHSLGNRIQVMRQSLDSLEHLYSTEGSDIKQRLEQNLENSRTASEFIDYSHMSDDQKRERERWGEYYGKDLKEAPFDVLFRVWPNWPQNPNDWTQEHIDLLFGFIDEAEQHVRPVLDLQREHEEYAHQLNNLNPTFGDFCSYIPLPNQPLNGEEPLFFDETRGFLEDLRFWPDVWASDEGRRARLIYFMGRVPPQWTGETPPDPNDQSDPHIREQALALYNKAYYLVFEMGEPDPRQNQLVFLAETLAYKYVLDYFPRWLQRESDLNANVLPGMTEQARQQARIDRLELHPDDCDCYDCN